jgi:hypothetical protein
VPLTDVSKRLGHVNPHVTATVYAHALPGRDDLAAAAWEKFQKDAGRSKEPRMERTKEPGMSRSKEPRVPVKPSRARKSA